MTTSRSISPLRSQPQEEESDHELHSTYASLGATSFSCSRGTSVNATEDKVGSLFQWLKNQEELAQQ